MQKELMPHFLSIALLVFMPLQAQEEWPEIIDFGNPGQTLFKDFEAQLAETVPMIYAFNGAPELGAFFIYMRDAFQIDTVLETGTYEGVTTLFFSYLFSNVYTIEIEPSFYEYTKSMFLSSPRIKSYLGSSDQILSHLLPSLNAKPVIFYLDAHWKEEWPLLKELEAISKSHRDRCIIIIDDIKVPGRDDIAYDRYGKDECSYEYVKEHLKAIFTDYAYFYLIPKQTLARAKLVILPRRFGPPGL